MAETLTLEFEGYPGESVTLRLSPIPMADYFDVLKRFQNTDRRDPDALLAFFGRFADVALESWTFPEPANAEGIGRRDLNLVLSVVNQWLEHVGAIPVPLPVGSSATELSAARLTPAPAARSKRRRS